MVDLSVFVQEWNDAIKKIYPHEDFEVTFFGDSIFVNLYKGGFQSNSTYFPFGTFSEDLSRRMSPEMFKFWKTVDDLRPLELDGNCVWRYSIGTQNKKYVNMSSFRKEIRDQGLADQLKKDAEWLNENAPMPWETEESSAEQQSEDKESGDEKNEEKGAENKKSSKKLFLSSKIRFVAKKLLSE